ncbi:MAG: hypothetical protein LUE91_05940 [Oscillospiraceae bacterium]|nr:hypothetical protein [Oscillospiraceae bacterium]
MSEFEDKLQSILGNPEAMSQIMSIAQSLNNSSGSSGPTEHAERAPSSAPPDQSGQAGLDLGSLDPRLLQLGGKILSEYRSADDSRAALLNALRPFLKPERGAKIDQAIEIARLSRVIRLALDAFRKGDAHV